MGLFDKFRKKENIKSEAVSVEKSTPEKETEEIIINNNEVDKNVTEPKEPEHEIILKSESLVCNAEAIVEKYEDCYYFYIFFPLSDKLKTKACWICNRRHAPDKVDVESMGNGKAPMMPAEYVAHDPDGIELDEKNLSIVWFEEGESAALLCKEDILAVIPSWSGMNNFHGYSRYAKGTGYFAWEITKALNNLNARVKNSKLLWDNFANPQNATKWVSCQHAPAREFLVNHEQDFNIANKFDKKPFEGPFSFPPRVVVQGSRNGVVYGITAGVSLIPMPKVELSVKDNPRDISRIEIGFAVEEKFRQYCQPMYINLSMYAGIPWHQQTFIAHGHTVPFKNLKGYAAVMFVNPRFVEGLESPQYSDFLDGSKVNMLWTVLITQKEYDFAVNNSSEELLKKAKNMSRIHIFDGNSKFDLE